MTEQHTGQYRDDQKKDTFYKKQLNVYHLVLTLQLATDDLDIAPGVLEGLLSFSALTIFNMSLGVAVMS